jgi:hypothetical protein
MMDDLIDAVARAAGLPPAQAALAVAAMLRFFTARMPSALVGELHARLQAPPASGASGASAGAPSSESDR